MNWSLAFSAAAAVGGGLLLSSRLSWGHGNPPPVTLASSASIPSDDDDSSSSRSEGELSEFDPSDVSSSNSPADIIDLAQLVQLTRSSNIKIRKSAWQLLLDIAATDEYLLQIVETGRSVSKDSVMFKRVVTVLHLLSRHDLNAEKLMDAGGCLVLVQAVDHPDIRVVEMAVSGLTNCLTQRPELLRVLVDAGLLMRTRLKLEALGAHYISVVKALLDLVLVFIGDERIYDELIGASYLKSLAVTCSLFNGDFHVQKKCMACMVRLINSLDADEACRRMRQLMDLGIIQTLTYCVQSNNSELVYWSVGFIHEFAIKDIERASFSSIKSFPRILVDFIMDADEPSVIRIGLRTIKFMCHKNSEFQKRMIRESRVLELLDDLSPFDGDTLYWIVQVLRDLSKHELSHPAFMRNPQSLRLLMHQASSNSFPLVLFIADIFVFLSSDPSVRSVLFDNGLAETILSFMSHRDTDLQISAITLIFNSINLANMPYMDPLFNLHSLTYISSLLVSLVHQKDCGATCAKVLVTMALKRPRIAEIVRQITVDPLISIVTRIVRPLFHLTCSGSGTNFDIKNKEVLNSINKECRVLISSEGKPIVFDRTLDSSHILNFSHITECLKILLDNPTTSISSLEELENIHMELVPLFIAASLIALNELSETFPITLYRDGLLDANAFIKANNLYAISANIALLACSFCRSEKFRKAMISARFNDIIFLFCARKTAIQSQAIVHFAKLIKMDNKFCDSLNNRPNIEFEVGRILSACKKDLSLSVCGNIIKSQFDLEPQPPVPKCHFSRAHSTAKAMISMDGLQAYNAYWTFETVVCNIGSSNAAKCVYEVEIVTDGLLQIGWTLIPTCFDPEVGTGCGDDATSYSVDGVRMAKWHRQQSLDNSYGKAWHPTDVIGCAIDLHAMTIEYFLNGESMGVAFEGISHGIWHPAVSLSTDQLCKIRMDSLQYHYDGYDTLYSLKSRK